MRNVCAVIVIIGFLCCPKVMFAAVKAKEAVPEFIKVEKAGRSQILTITGRIKSRHERFQKGRSIRSYYIVTPDMKKISLPRSHVEHRDGTISGINLKLFKSKDVVLVCNGRVKDDEKKGLLITVKKILSVRAQERGKSAAK